DLETRHVREFASLAARLCAVEAAAKPQSREVRTAQSDPNKSAHATINHQPFTGNLNPIETPSTINHMVRGLASTTQTARRVRAVGRPDVFPVHPDTLTNPDRLDEWF